MYKNQRISLVMPCYNEEHGLPEVYRDLPALIDEVIAVDNNSTDRTAEIARAAGATVVFEPVNQIARARNSGAAVATGDWLVFIDADSHPSAALMQDVAEAIQSGRFLAGGATVRLEDGYPMLSFITGLWNLLSRTSR